MDTYQLLLAIAGQVKNTLREIGSRERNELLNVIRIEIMFNQFDIPQERILTIGLLSHFMINGYDVSN